MIKNINSVRNKRKLSNGVKSLTFLFFLTIFFASSYFLIPISARAIDKAQAAEMNMAARVSSLVSKENSSIQLNAQETLADPVNHPILLTVILQDKDQKALSDKEVVVTSNRGKVDIIEPISKISAYQVHAAEADIQKDKTDQKGEVQFRITSFIPGLTSLKIMADNIVELPSQTIKFDPLPFPAELVLSVSLPWTSREFTIYSPRIQEESLSAAQIEAKRSANPETKIKINFWVFALFLLIVIGMPIFSVLNFINLRKIRRTTDRE